MNHETSIQNSQSVLHLKQVFFDHLKFVRTGFPHASQQDVKVKVGTAINKQSDNQYQVSLSVHADRPGEFQSHVQISALCEIQDDDIRTETILKKNTVAILFPYVRSAFTLLTAQPGMEPVVLPALNINALIDELEQKES